MSNVRVQCLCYLCVIMKSKSPVYPALVDEKYAIFGSPQIPLCWSDTRVSKIAMYMVK